MLYIYIHCKIIYEIPGFVLTKPFLDPARKSSVSDIPAGDGNTSKLFYSVGYVKESMTGYLEKPKSNYRLVNT